MTTTLTTLLANIGEASNRTLVLPLVAFFPTSRCNSRCQSCSWWESTGEDDLTPLEVEALADALANLGTKLVAFTGGEPLLRADVFDLARIFRQRGMTLHLLTSGLALGSRADQIALWFERVIVSLDAASRADYARVRGVDAFDTVIAGVRRLRQLSPMTQVHARATLHKLNFRAVPELVRTARGTGFHSISFLSADVSRRAFGRGHDAPTSHLMLDRDEVAVFRDAVEECIDREAAAFASGFIAGSPAALRRLPQYYAALLGDEPFPSVSCNAPWVSAVIEANGAVKPCFFHAPVGTIRDTPLATLVRRHLREFRASLDMHTDETCRQCVCSLKTGWRQHPWR